MEKHERRQIMKKIRKKDGSYVIKSSNGLISGHLPSDKSTVPPTSSETVSTQNPYTNVEKTSNIDEKFKAFITSEHDYPEPDYTTPLEEMPPAYRYIEGLDPYKRSSYELLKNGSILFDAAKDPKYAEAMQGYFLTAEQHATLFEGSDTPISSEARAEEITKLENLNKELHNTNNDLENQIEKINSKTNWGTAIASSAGSAGGGLAGLGASTADMIAVGGLPAVAIGITMFGVMAGFTAYPILKNKAAKKTSMLSKEIENNKSLMSGNKEKIHFLKTQTITYEEISRRAVKGKILE